MNNDTICALCTLPGKSALSVIRISGPKALEITKKQASFLPRSIESHRAYVGVLKKNNREIDQVVLTYFAQGKSFTGEETLEISCHGGLVSNEILKELLEDGARLAKRGEFSFQSFSNGKMDLVQAEGLYQVIESENKKSQEISLQQLRGVLSKKLNQIEKNWLTLLSHVEADIDFSMEGLELYAEEKIKTSLENLLKNIKKLVSSYQPFDRIQRGLECGFFGPVNSGKSTLFNSLLGEDKAIVSGEEGTTRDVVEGALRVEVGSNFLLKDTAGARKTSSEGEQKGQEKTKKVFESSDLQIFVVDSTKLDFWTKAEADFPLKPKQVPAFLVFTKKDLCPKAWTKEELFKKFQQQAPAFSDFSKEEVFFVSAFTGENLEELKTKILLFGRRQSSEFLIINQRHYQGLKTMEGALVEALKILNLQEGERDLIALELRRGLLALYEILGRQMDDEILAEIFKQFCIGK
ncbi:MAG: tRNA uridine-5-carboxymethylaminomethyl(34) synthesis GTPase MnmE [Bdellovibrionales bacterium]